MTALNKLRIVHLLELPEAADTLVRWFIEEWTPWYGPKGQGDAESDLAACRSRETLPICLIALDSDDTVLGTAAIKSESVGSELGVGPWLAALLVAKEHRCKGVGTALIEAVERHAQGLGFEAIYCSTDTTEGILAHRGWEPFGTTETLRGSAVVYRRPLLPSSDLSEKPSQNHPLEPA